MHDLIARVTGGIDLPGLLDAIDTVRDHVLQDLDGALALAWALVEASDASGDATARIRSRSAHAHALSYANRFEASLDALDEACAIGDAAGLHVEVARARLAKIQGLARLGRLPEALDEGRAAFAVLDESGDRERAGMAATNIAIVLRMLDRQTEALEAFDLAITKLQDPGFIAQVRNNRAQVLLELCRFTEAASEFEASITYLDEHGLTRAAAIVLGNLAELRMQQGRYADALVAYEKARRSFDSDTAIAERARVEAEIAELLLLVGQRQEAQHFLRHAAPLLRDAGMTLEHARCCLALSPFCDHDEAFGLLDEAARAYEAVDHASGRRRVTLACCDRMLELGHAADVLDLLERPESPATLLDALDCLRRAEAALAVDDAPEAEACIAAARHLGDLLDVHPLRVRAMHLHGLLQARADLATGLDTLLQAVEASDSLRASLQDHGLRSTFQDTLRTLHEDAYDLARRARRLDDAFMVAEHARAHWFRDRREFDLLTLDPGL
ncbi:MAG: hypothetical protein KDA28_03550, partial [Phycisphaerales bacterium]|nr:hypothetical protein [Phycisphaerales bacterium]